MTRFDFLNLCGQNCIDPSVALENDNITEALKSGDDKLVSKLIREAF